MPSAASSLRLIEAPAALALAIVEPVETPKRLPKLGDPAVCRYWGYLWVGTLGTVAGSTFEGDLNAIIFNPNAAPTGHWPHRNPEVWIDSVEYCGRWDDMMGAWVVRASDD